MAHWIQAAENALATTAATTAAATADVDVDVVERFTPPVFDATGVRAATAPLLAAFLWSAVVLRDTQAHSPLDPLSLLLRLLALALTVRALVLSATLLRRLRVRMSLPRYGLVLTPAGLLYRSPQGDVVLPRQDVVEVREHGQWRQRAGRRWADVYVIAHPRSGRLYLTLPPVFERTPGVLAERLMRWLGPPAERDAASFPDPAALASKLWESVAAGERPSDVAVVERSSAWLRRGPYTSLLLGIAMLDGLLRLPASLRAALLAGPAVWLLVATVAVPVIWVLLTRRGMARGGPLALLLTPAELLLRTRRGILRLRWPEIKALAIETRGAWSILQGAYESRTVVIRHQDGEHNRIAEAVIAVPAEVLVGLAEGYRKGALLPAAAQGAASVPAS